MQLKFAIIVSQFNSEYTHGLLKGSLEYLKEKNIAHLDSDTYYAPGAFEIPLIAKKLAQTKKYAGIICLGCVIKGDTAHFEFISGGATLGILQAMLETEIPISFGILTTYTDDQAQLRCQEGQPTNKGREAAAACLETAQLLQKI